MKEVYGDLVESPADILVNPVNCIGVMGKGLALDFKNKFPENFKAYKKFCEIGFPVAGDIYVFRENDKKIVNVFTKNHWRDSSSVEIVKKCLENIVDYVDKIKYYKQHKSLAISLIGSGLGGVPRNLVYEYVYKYLGNMYNWPEIYLYLGKEFNDNK